MEKMSHDSVKEIIYYLKHTASLSQDDVHNAVRALGDLKNKTAVPFLLNMLVKSKQPNFVRDALAISLGELGANGAVPFIIQLIHNPRNINNRGSLIYALWNLDCQDYFLEFIEIVCAGNFECRQMALELVKKYSNEIDAETRKEAFKVLERFKLLHEISDKKEEELNILNLIEHVEGMLIDVNK